MYMHGKPQVTISCSIDQGFDLNLRGVDLNNASDNDGLIPPETENEATFEDMQLGTESKLLNTNVLVTR
jgi:hypothetical protein